MAILSTLNPTLLDIQRRLDPKNKIAGVIEVLKERNEILMDMPFIEGNLPNGNVATIRTGLPTVTWRKLNYGVVPDTSQTAQITDLLGMIEAFSQIDEEAIVNKANLKAFRTSEDVAQIQSMNNAMATALFYGDATINPEQFNGLDCRFNELSSDDTKSGSNIIVGGGSGNDNTSIWLIGWGPRTVTGFYANGASGGGLSMEDLGRDKITDSQGRIYMGYHSHFRWRMGLCVQDWRYVVRIANIDVSDLTADKSGNSADLTDLMIQAIEQIESLTGVRAAFYCNKTVRSVLRRQILNTTNVRLRMEEVAGKQVMMFDGIPVRRCDAILNTEATIS